MWKEDPRTRITNYPVLLSNILNFFFTVRATVSPGVLVLLRYFRKFGVQLRAFLVIRF